MAFGHAIGQKEGDSWVIGYSVSQHTEYSVLQMDFRSGNLEVRRMLNEYSFTKETGSTICDDEGIPLIWTNG